MKRLPPLGVLTGDIIGEYMLSSAIGAGGYGCVYDARHMLTDERVAVKVLHDSLKPRTLERFERGCECASKLDHPGLVRVIDSGVYKGYPFIVMAFVEGVTLGQILKQRGPFAASLARDCIRELASTLAYVHDHGVLHRDIKAENVIRGHDGKLYLGDFDLARPMEDDERGAALRARGVGTVPYMSPEQLKGRDLDARADIYALGAMWYELLEGGPPHGKGPSEELARRILQETPKPFTRSDLPARDARLIRRMLSRNPAKRPRTMHEVIALLEWPESKVHPDSRVNADEESSVATGGSSVVIDPDAPRPEHARVAADTDEGDDDDTGEELAPSTLPARPTRAETLRRLAPFAAAAAVVVAVAGAFVLGTRTAAPPARRSIVPRTAVAPLPATGGQNALEVIRAVREELAANDLRGAQALLDAARGPRSAPEVARLRAVVRDLQAMAIRAEANLEIALALDTPLRAEGEAVALLEVAGDGCTIERLGYQEQTTRVELVASLDAASVAALYDLAPDAHAATAYRRRAAHARHVAGDAPLADRFAAACARLGGEVTAVEER